MSNLFILVKCKKYVPESTMRKISPHAIKYNFLWIGGNHIENYHIHQYRGPTKKLLPFKKEVNNIFRESKLKYSIISGNKDFLKKPSEHDITIYTGEITSFSVNKNKLHEEKTKINKKYISKIILKLNKTKYGYHLPLLLKKIRKEHTLKVRYDVFIKFHGNNTNLYSESKYAIRITKEWLKRVYTLCKKIK